MTNKPALIVSVTNHDYVVLQDLDRKEIFHPYIDNFKCDYIQHNNELDIDICSKYLYSHNQKTYVITAGMGILSTLCFFQSITTCVVAIAVLGTITGSSLFHTDDKQLPTLDHFLRYHPHLLEVINASKQQATADVLQSGECPVIDSYIFDDCTVQINN